MAAMVTGAASRTGAAAPDPASREVLGSPRSQGARRRRECQAQRRAPEAPALRAGGENRHV
jgi:hypothetical protein